MEQELCKNCIRTRGMRKAVCPECHGENVQAWLEGPCMFLCCPDCLYAARPLFPAGADRSGCMTFS